MTDLDELIMYWRMVLVTSGHLMQTSAIARVDNTIKALEELKKLKGN